jgi:two-component system, NtrC family, sensor kinase
MRNSPWFFVSRIAISIFCAETFIMLVFLLLPNMPQLVEVFLDSTLLSILISPALYFFLYRPFNHQYQERLLIEKELRQSEVDLKQKAEQLEKTMKKLQLAPQLLQAEKMSSLGRLVAGIAHEINNPVNFIHVNLFHLNQYTQALVDLINLYRQLYPDANAEIEVLIEKSETDFVIKDLPMLLSSMEAGTKRIEKIILALRNFCRLDEAQIKSVNIHDGIDSTLLLISHQLKSEMGTSIEIVKEYGDLPHVECYPSQLNQVFMNLLINAIDVLNKSHKDGYIYPITSDARVIIICTELINKNWVKISIKDNGIGINDQIKSELFEPFFTTKSVGEGIGLGLFISYQIIVNQHRGHMQCISATGKGAEFIIEIPIIRVDAHQSINVC